jgi:hypothetical protein
MNDSSSKSSKLGIYVSSLLFRRKSLSKLRIGWHNNVPERLPIKASADSEYLVNRFDDLLLSQRAILPGLIWCLAKGWAP